MSEKDKELEDETIDNLNPWKRKQMVGVVLYSVCGVLSILIFYSNISMRGYARYEENPLIVDAIFHFSMATTLFLIALRDIVIKIIIPSAEINSKYMRYPLQSTYMKLTYNFNHKRIPISDIQEVYEYNNFVRVKGEGQLVFDINSKHLQNYEEFKKTLFMVLERRDIPIIDAETLDMPKIHM